MKKLKFLVINGPNLDMLGVRNPEIYGKETYSDLKNMISSHCEKIGVEVIFLQTYFEGEIARVIAHMNKVVPQDLEGPFGMEMDSGMDYKNCDGIVINPGAYSHYSYAIRDAIELNDTKIAEVHISDIEKREAFRHNDVIKDVVDVYIKGEGFMGYTKAIDKLKIIIEGSSNG